MSARARTHDLTPRASRPVLVAGGAGFLGSHLCERLLADGHRVLCLDDFTTGTRRTIAPLLEHPGFQLLDHDVITPLLIDAQAVLNFACPASPPQYQAQPIRTTRTSVEGTYNMLALAQWNHAPMLQASTSEVYGEPGVHPQPEGYWGHVNPIGIRACYDEGKRCAESLCFDFHRRHDVVIKVARIFNTYGPRMQLNDGRVVSNFLVQALRNDPITIYGDGSQTRAFCYVDDLIEGLVRFLWTGAAVTGPLNLGNPDEYSVRELAEQVIRITGSRSAIVHRPRPADDPTHRRPDITEARESLHWAPTIPLDEGLRRTATYFEEQLTIGTLPSTARAIAVGGTPIVSSRSGVTGDLTLTVTTNAKR